MTRQDKLRQLADAHGSWVSANLTAVADRFEPRDAKSDYNQHNVDIDADGEAEDAFAAVVAGIFPAPGHDAKSFKHLPGRHNQDDHGGDATPDLGGLDKLKLASRIQLGEGEKLLSSRKFKTARDDGSMDLLAAEVDTPNGREVRLGVIDQDDSKRWAAGPDPQRTARMAEIRAERDQLDEDDPRFEELYDELAELESEADDVGFNRTATLTPAAITQLHGTLAEAAAKAQEWSRAWRQFGQDHEAEISEHVDLAEVERRGGTLTSEQAARFAELSAILDGGPEWEPRFAEGTLSAGGDGDLAYLVQGFDGEEGDWRVDLGIRPRDEDDSWYPGSNDDAAKIDPKDVKAFLAGLAELAGEQAKAATGRRRSIKRTYVRDSEGQFAETPGGDTSVVTDKLKGAGRIELEPGERLLGSDRTRGENGRAWLAVVEKDGERSLRIGLGNADFGTRHDSNGPWRAAEDRSYEINEERQELIERREELEKEIEELEADPGTDPAGLAERRAQLEELENADVDEVFPNGHTAILDEQGAKQLRQTLAKALDDGEKILAAFEPNQDEIDRLEARRDNLRRMGRRWTDEEDAEWDRLTAEVERLEAEQDAAPGPERPERGFWVLAEGSIPGRWANVHYEVFLDDPTVGVEAKLGAIPHHYDQDFAEFQDEGAHAAFAMSEADELVQLLAKLDATKSGAAFRRSHIKRSSTGETMQLKSFQPEVKAVGSKGDEGTATIAIATLNVVDKDGDVTLPGFFGEQWAQLVPTHDWDHVWMGKGRVYEKGDQALVDVKFNLKIPAAKDWYEAIKFDYENPPALGEYSYGYHVLDGGSRKGTFKGQAVRYLTPRPDGTAGSKVFEFSPVLLGAGEGTGTVDVKSLARERIAARKARTGALGLYAGAVAPHETATVARSWDGVKTVAGLPDDALPSHLRTVYAWVDPAGDPELKASYKFPHHHGVSGPANIRACLAGIAVLNGATGGVDLSDADRKSVYDHLAGHLRDADREPPSLRTDLGAASGKNLRFGDEAANVLAGVAGLIDRASDVMAIRRTKGKAMSANTADLLSWVRDECKRLDSLLSQPIEADDEPSIHVTDEEIASVVLAAVARLHDN